LAVGTVLLFGATVISAIVLNSTDDAVHKQLIATTRAWIQPNEVTVSDLMITEAYELVTNIGVGYLNVGHSPAHNIDIRAAIFVGGASVDDASAQCRRDPPRKGRWSDESVFAGQGDVARANLHVKNLDAFKLDGRAPFVAFAVAGCIIYTFQGSEGFHHTTFLATIMRKKDHPAKGNEGGTGIDALAVGRLDPRDLDSQIVSVGTSAN
jgi:hypothetical protein